jgi:hypothetical protein
MIGSPISEESLTFYGSFTSSSSYKPMLYLALAGLPFSFRTVNLKIGVQSTPEYLEINRWGVVPSLRHRADIVVDHPDGGPPAHPFRPYSFHPCRLAWINCPSLDVAAIKAS